MKIVSLDRVKAVLVSMTIFSLAYALQSYRAANAEEAQETASPAEFVGAETCLSCHEAQSGFKDNIHAKAMPAAKGIEFSKTCETCHGPGSLHAGAAGDKSDPGFATIKNPKKLDAAEASATCLKCHEKGGQAHWAGSTHESHGVSCANCHSPHSGHKKNLAKAEVTDVCYQCHKDVKAQMSRASHHPVKEGKMDCADCHNPHGTVGEKLLVGDTVNETCAKCHTEKRGPFLFEHRPVSEHCTICHTPHGSNHGKLLAKKVPFNCQSCHSISRHPGTLYGINPSAAGTNTYQKSSNRATFRACLNCHQNIHGSNHPGGAFFMR